MAKITCMGPKIMAAMEHFFLEAEVTRTDGFLVGPLAFPVHGLQILYHSVRRPRHCTDGKHRIRALDMAAVHRR